VEIERRSAFRGELSGELLDDALKLLTWANTPDGAKQPSDALKKRSAAKIPSGVTPSPVPGPVDAPRRPSTGKAGGGSRRPAKG
jgi:hypothetical protein